MTIQNTAVEGEAMERAKIQSDAQHGILGSWWQLGIGMSEATVTFCFGIAQDTRIEVKRRTDATLTFAEEMGVGSFRFLQKLVDRLDRISGEVLGRSEATMMVVARTLRKTGHGVTDLASTTLSDAIGSGPTRKADGVRAHAAA
jgi:hypothetical protein